MPKHHSPRGVIYGENGIICCIIPEASWGQRSGSRPLPPTQLDLAGVRVEAQIFVPATGGKLATGGSLIPTPRGGGGVLAGSYSKTFEEGCYTNALPKTVLDLEQIGQHQGLW